MRQIVAFAYGLLAYVIFLLTFLYSVGFVGNLVVPKSIDSGAEGPAGPALLVNAILLGLFAVQHSVMARPAFKRRWVRIVLPPVERSTYVLLSSLLLALLFWQWCPMTREVWNVEGEAGRLALQVLFWLGWLLVLLSTFAIDRFDLFGLRQVYFPRRGRTYAPVRFQEPALYGYVRHGWRNAICWAPTATPRARGNWMDLSEARTARPGRAQEV